MRKLYWAVTSHCQLSCRYCFYETGAFPRILPQLKLEKARQFIKELPAFFEKIVFTGGEVLLYPHFFDLIEAAYHNNIRTMFLTDGVLLNNKAIEKIQRYNVENVYVSLDSLDPEVNMSLRPYNTKRPRTSQDIVENIKQLKKSCSHTKVAIMQTITKENLDSVWPMMEFCQEYNIKLSIHPVGKVSEESMSLETCSNQQFITLEKMMLEWANSDPRLIKYVKTVIAMLRRQPLPELHCSKGSKHFFLDVTGNLFPCFHRVDMKLGNVWQESLEDIFIGKRDLVEEVGQELKPAPCASLACACLLD